MADHQPLRAISAEHGVELLLDGQMRGRRRAGRADPLRASGSRPVRPRYHKRPERIVEDGCRAVVARRHRRSHAPVDVVERELRIFGADAAVDEQGVADLGDRRVARRPSAELARRAPREPVLDPAERSLRQPLVADLATASALGSAAGASSCLRMRHVEPFAAGHATGRRRRPHIRPASCSDCRRAGSSPRDCRGRRSTRPPARGASRLKLLKAADDLQRVRAAVGDVAELDERRRTARPMAGRDRRSRPRSRCRSTPGSRHGDRRRR